MPHAVVLVVGMLISGVCNTILNKLQDRQCVANCDDPDPSKHELFEQPVWQTLNMFVGETLCIFVVYAGYLLSKNRVPVAASQPTPQPTPHPNRSRQYEHEDLAPSVVNELNAAVIVDDVEDAKMRQQRQSGAPPMRGWEMLLFWLPTLCDLTATTLMNVGLIYTAASIYQMLRGFVIIMTAVFSVTFLNRKLFLYQWLSLLVVIIGLVIVGLSSVLFPQKRGSTFDAEFQWESLIGVSLVLLAQVFTATQFVIEEKVMSHYRVAPVTVVALEGSFGLTTVLSAMLVFYFAIGKSHPGSYFDAPEGFHQIISNTTLWVSGVAICFSIAFFNFFGLSVTQKLSATARSLIDTCRTLFIWLVSIFLGWERFSWLQVCGFILLVSGTFVFNDVFSFFTPKAEAEEQEPLLRED